MNGAAAAILPGGKVAGMAGYAASKAGVTAFLCSTEAANITGQVIELA